MIEQNITETQAKDLAELKRTEAENLRLREEQAEKVKEFDSKKGVKNSSVYMKNMSDEEFDKYVENVRKQRENVPDDIEMTYMDIPENLKDPRFVYYWMNDYQGRLNQAISRGWTFCKDLAISKSKNLPEGENIKISNGSGGAAYLMMIPKELWDEDQKKVAAKNNQYADYIEGRDPNLDKRIKSSKSKSFEDISDFE